MTTTLWLILIVLTTLVLAFYLSRLMAKKALRNVVSLFREHEATSPEKARTLEEIGLIEGTMLDRMFKLRDYRPQALRLLAQTGIIRMTEEQRFYLSEEDLERSPLKDRMGI